MRKLDFTKEVLKFLSLLPPKQHKQVVQAIFELLKNPRPHDSQLLRKSDHFFRKNIGEYRLIYQYDDEVIVIYLVGKRNDDEVYRKFKQLD